MWSFILVVILNVLPPVSSHTGCDPKCTPASSSGAGVQVAGAAGLQPVQGDTGPGLVSGCLVVSQGSRCP